MMRMLVAFCGIVMLLPATAADPKGDEIKVKAADLKREAIVFAPASAAKKAAPVVFVFHGHGSSAEKAAKKFDIHGHWPQAIVVYMQGLPIPSNTDPAGKKDGWQHQPGEVGDRDLIFFDKTLARIKKDYKVDADRVYATGQSNGGGFTYLLWAKRGEALAAVAPCSASNGNNYLDELKPKPVLHIGGKEDDTAPFKNQRKLMDAIRKLNGCEAKGKEWHKAGTSFASSGGTPFVEVVHPGGHELPEEMPKLIAAFFKELKKP